MEQGDVSLRFGHLARLWLFFAVPFTPHESFTFHGGGDVLKDLQIFKTFEGSPNLFIQELKRLRLHRRIRMEFLLDESIILMLINLSLSDKDSECEHGGESQFMVL
jgi:hypothetical protein